MPETQATFYRDGAGREPVDDELRCHYGRTLYRVLYRRSRNLFVLLHIIEKRTGKIAEQDIAMAEGRFDDLRRRMEARPRRRPRALGHDAPPKRRRMSG